VAGPHFMQALLGVAPSSCLSLLLFVFLRLDLGLGRRLGFRRREAGQERPSDAGHRWIAIVGVCIRFALLEHVRQFVRDQVPAGGRRRHVAAWRERDVRTVRERVGT